MNLETELACDGDTVTWVASGADDYTWFGINGFEDPIELFNPGYAETGTDISELTLAGIDDPVVVEVSGSIPYIIPGSGTFASCFTSSTTNTNLSATASEYELPTLSPEFTVAPVFCEGGTVDFLDLSEGESPSSTSYSFFATTGLELDNVPSSQTSLKSLRIPQCSKSRSPSCTFRGRTAWCVQRNSTALSWCLRLPRWRCQDLQAFAKVRKPR